MRLFLCGKTSRKANFAKDKVAMALFLIMISRTEGYWTGKVRKTMLEKESLPDCVWRRLLLLKSCPFSSRSRPGHDKADDGGHHN